MNIKLEESQLTTARQGHTLHHAQVFSKDGKWIVYDTRNDDTQIGSTGRIEMINIETGESKVLYQTSNQSEYGPGVGAATFSPVANRVLFIQGIRNSDEHKPYGMTRRTGVAIDIERPEQPIFMDARDIFPPFTAGALRGGTHAHSWSGDGEWISFTYNDYIMEQLAKTDSSVLDLRVVGVMCPGKVVVKDDGSLENNRGEMFSAVVTEVTERPRWGSDEIEKAFDEAWIGKDGYIKTGGAKQKRAIAFQGNVRDSLGNIVTEVFVVNIPNDITQAVVDKPLEGTGKSRPNPPQGTEQRRLTFTSSRKYPGIQGPRHWLRTSADGQSVFFLMKDDEGIVQVFAVPTVGGQIRQVTKNPFAVQSAFSISPDDRFVSYVSDNSVFITEIGSGETERITRKSSDANAPIGAITWSYDGSCLAYNRYVTDGDERWLQLFVLK
ncbi:DUF3748 domain-containing protein [Olivibacter sitiensis]|uniref:DUF3748 domain-containing protein n=1 Tax=Olivibacter sitiensis TaxID=376470 RepID=UPI00041E386A|nr:DUF3748 domain-containing protein [Olivibacter sitiensis]